MVSKVSRMRLRVAAEVSASKLVVQTRKMFTTMPSVRVKRSAERMLICSEASAQQIFSSRSGRSRVASTSSV